MGVGEYRLATALAMSCLACGRIGFDDSAIADGASGGESAVDGSPAIVDASPPAPDASPLVTGCADDDGSDIDFDGIPDACDPCVSADKMADPCAADNGVPTLALMPAWSEKAFQMALNIARADHVGFRDEYMTFSDASASEVFGDSPTPRSSLHYRQVSAEGGRMHTASFVNCKTTPGSFELCDGTPWTTWKVPYNPLDSAVMVDGSGSGGITTPIFYIGLLACDGIGSFSSVSGCPASSSTRQNAFYNNSASQVGPAVATGNGKNAWDLLFSNSAPAFDFPIASGGHLFHNSEIHFGINVDVGVDEAPIGASIVIDEVSTALPLALGAPTLGFYRLTEAPGATCRSYHFELVDAAGNLWRYPTSGQYRTFGEGSCTEEWLP